MYSDEVGQRINADESQDGRFVEGFRVVSPVVSQLQSTGLFHPRRVTFIGS
ncbi:MAG: hypothetical protein U0996_19450 [Planctomycetaceae bacterium]